MRYTLLEIVQRVLASMDSDEVTSITDTTESAQVGLLVEGAFYDIVSEAGIPPTGTFFSLAESGSATKPTLMTVPSEVIQFDWVKYDKKESGDTYADWTEIKYMPTDEFMEHINGFRTESSNVGTFNQSISTGEGTYTIPFMYRSNKHPDYYTSFDDSTLIFDSYDVALDTSYLLKAKTQCWGAVVPVFTQADSFVPDLNPNQQSLLMNMSKARAFEELKHMQNSNATMHARRNQIRLRTTKRKVPWEQPTPLSQLPNYGRK